MMREIVEVAFCADNQSLDEDQTLGAKFAVIYKRLIFYEKAQK